MMYNTKENGYSKAFNINDLHTEIIIKGTVNDPLFRASDIGVVLELSNIRMSIADFDESEKVVSQKILVTMDFISKKLVKS